MDNKKMTALNEMELENVNGGILGIDDIITWTCVGVAVLVGFVASMLKK